MVLNASYRFRGILTGLRRSTLVVILGRVRLIIIRLLRRLALVLRMSDTPLDAPCAPC